MLVRLIDFIIISTLIYYLIKLATASPKAPKPKAAFKEAPRRPEPQKPKAEELVEDPQCGVYIPKDSAIQGPDGKYFCSRECLEGYKAKG